MVGREDARGSERTEDAREVASDSKVTEQERSLWGPGLGVSGESRPPLPARMQGV